MIKMTKRPCSEEDLQKREAETRQVAKGYPWRDWVLWYKDRAEHQTQFFILE